MSPVQVTKISTNEYVLDRQVYSLHTQSILSFLFKNGKYWFPYRMISYLMNYIVCYTHIYHILNYCVLLNAHMRRQWPFMYLLKELRSFFPTSDYFLWWLRPVHYLHMNPIAVRFIHTYFKIHYFICANKYGILVYVLTSMYELIKFRRFHESVQP